VDTGSRQENAPKQEILGRNIEIAADAGADIGQRRPARVDFSASAFDFIMVAATCICVFPACMARRLLTILIISIRNTPTPAHYPGGS